MLLCEHHRYPDWNLGRSVFVNAPISSVVFGPVRPSCAALPHILWTRPAPTEGISACFARGVKCDQDDFLWPSLTNHLCPSLAFITREIIHAFCIVLFRVMKGNGRAAIKITNQYILTGGYLNVVRPFTPPPLDWLYNKSWKGWAVMIYMAIVVTTITAQWQSGNNITHTYNDLRISYNAPCRWKWNEPILLCWIENKR